MFYKSRFNDGYKGWGSAANVIHVLTCPLPLFYVLDRCLVLVCMGGEVRCWYIWDLVEVNGNCVERERDMLNGVKN